MRLSGFEGRVALVTGAGGGIGAALVRMLAEAGAQVIATDLEAPDQKPEGAAAGLAASGPGAAKAAAGAVHGMALDVRDPQAVADLVARTERDFGPVEILACVAGVLTTGPATECSTAAWRQVFAVNAEGLFHCCREVGARMQARRRGAIVGIGSNAAFVPRHGMAAYAASKAAATMFLRALGLELAPFGVRCNIVAPGSTLTPMQTGMWAGDSDGDSGAQAVIAGQPAQFRTGIPLGKLAQPEDVAQAAMFLLSDQAGHITMADLLVDGGATQRA